MSERVSMDAVVAQLERDLASPAAALAGAYIRSLSFP
jgi:hypothetical protein